MVHTGAIRFRRLHIHNESVGKQGQCVKCKDQNNLVEMVVGKERKREREVKVREGKYSK